MPLCTFLASISSLPFPRLRNGRFRNGALPCASRSLSPLFFSFFPSSRLSREDRPAVGTYILIPCPFSSPLSLRMRFFSFSFFFRSRTANTSSATRIWRLGWIVARPLPLAFYLLSYILLLSSFSFRPARTVWRSEQRSRFIEFDVDLFPLPFSLSR